MTVIRFETELCTGRIFLKWVLTKGLPKVYFDGFKGATITIMSSSIWTVCRRTVGAVGFYHLKTIQPSPSLTDNIRSGSKKSSYKSTWMALRERPEPLWASAFELFAEGRLSPSDFIILNPKHHQVSHIIFVPREHCKLCQGHLTVIFGEHFIRNGIITTAGVQYFFEPILEDNWWRHL